MLERLGAIPRRLRWALQRWSAPRDKAFHDALFASQRHDPFSFAYPGYVTIRRFADLALDRIGEARDVVDLGCGPAEITCEMARRRPDVRFTGVDHSEAAIARAREHAAALGLANIRFVAANVEQFEVDPAVGLVMMFDAFHHLLDPAAFVRRINARRIAAPRFLLVEPAGDWLGGWEKTLDLDWIAGALDTIRARLAWQIQTTAAAQQRGAAPPESAHHGDGAPTEHRYTMPDLQKFFDGYGLDARGTIAGLESYPRDPYARPALAERFGALTYDTLVALEDLLVEENLDLHAKHWVIHAERGAPHTLRTPRPIDPSPTGAAPRLQGACDVAYLAYDGTHRAPPRSTTTASVTFRNRGWREWASEPGGQGVFLSYHWFAEDGTTRIDDGLRTPLPRPVGPGETCTMSCRIETPPDAGRYILAIDLVDEGVTWFSRAGAPLLKVGFDVR